MALQSNSSNLRNESINSVWFSPSIREKPCGLKSSLPPLKRMVIYFSRDSSPLSNRMECSCFSFQILPTSIGSSSLVTATGCFSYPNLIMIEDKPIGLLLRQLNCRIHRFHLLNIGHWNPVGELHPKTDYRWHVPIYFYTAWLHRWYGFPVLSANHW